MAVKPLQGLYTQTNVDGIGLALDLPSNRRGLEV